MTTSHSEVLHDVSCMECVPLGTKQQEVMLENGTTNDFTLPSDTGGQDLNDCNGNNMSGWWVCHTAFYNGLKFI